MSWGGLSSFMAYPKGVKLITIGTINLDGSPQMRHHVSDEVVRDYAEIYRTSTRTMDPFPPIELFRVKGRAQLYLADGLHRIQAARMAGLTVIKGVVHDGTWADCLRAACSYNVTHGLRRSDEDKRRVVETILMHGGAKYANNYIAALGRVSEDLVSKTRKILEGIGSIDKVEFRRSKEGVERRVPEKKPRLWEGKDKAGTPIPPEAKAYWERRSEPRALIDKLEEIRAALYKVSATKDPLYCEVDFHAAAADIMRLTANLKTAVPYAVCTQCQGRVAGGVCTMCGGRGLISEFRYSNCSPEEIKHIRSLDNRAQSISTNGD